jgi:hypothetical protein
LGSARLASAPDFGEIATECGDRWPLFSSYAAAEAPMARKTRLQAPLGNSVDHRAKPSAIPCKRKLCCFHGRSRLPHWTIRAGSNVRNDHSPSGFAAASTASKHLGSAIDRLIRVVITKSAKFV